MKFAKIVSLVLCVVFLTVALAGCGGGSSTGPDAGNSGGEKPAQKVFVNIATGATSATYYPVGSGLAKMINDNVPNATANAETTGASVANVELVATGQTELALAQNDVVFYADTGTEIFKDKGKMEGMTAIAVLFPEMVQIIARKDANIKTVADLKGKRVVVGQPGSGTEVSARCILEVYGLTYDDLGKADFLSIGDGVDQIKNNQIDAAFVTGGLPTSAISEVCATHDMNLVEIEVEKVEELAKSYPFYTAATVPAGTYNGIDEDVPTATVSAMLIANKDLSEEVVYNITKVIFENKDKEQYQTHQRIKEIDVNKAIEGLPIDFHPGAEKYFKEIGLL
jgi:TRAP transporter TAXI family solute receptor